MPAPRSGGGAYGPPPQPNPWLIGLAVAVVLAAVSIIAFGFLAPGDETAGTTTSTTAGDGSTTSTTGDGTTSTTGDGTTGTDGTTSTTGTDGTVTTSSIPDGETPPVTAFGDPIPITELTLTKDDIGPLDFGDDGDQVLGRLVATFDEPTQDTGFIVGSGSWGECPGDAIRVVQWGPLNVVVKGQVGNSVFVSYRLDVKYGGITSPPTDLETKSGLRVMDTVAQMKEIYPGFAIDFVVHAEAGLVFELRAERGGELLLWGPVEASSDDAKVTGIYSPDSCNRTFGTGE